MGRPEPPFSTCLSLLTALTPGLQAAPPGPRGICPRKHPVLLPALLGVMLASTLLIVSHRFPSRTVCFGTTVSLPQGHMENEIREVMCVKNNQGREKKKKECFTMWLRNSCFSNGKPWVGRQSS